MMQNKDNFNTYREFLERIGNCSPPRGNGIYQHSGARFRDDFEAFFPLYAVFFLLLGKDYDIRLITILVDFKGDNEQRQALPNEALVFAFVFYSISSIDIS